MSPRYPPVEPDLCPECDWPMDQCQCDVIGSLDDEPDRRRDGEDD